MKLDEIDYTNELMLVVDDEEAVREPLAEMLNLMGFRAQSAPNGREALRKAREMPYSFVITDMRMPEMDGLELIRRLSNDHEDICIIAVTGHTKGYKYIDVINAGAADFINKPFSAEELEAKIKRAIIERNIKRELNRLSITDALTGLYNQGHFYIRLNEEIRRARRQKHKLALILLDLDYFKRYNDTYGHLAGDELLQKVGNIINASIRQGVDSGYRYGGDEFAIILIDADAEIAQDIAKRIQNAMTEDCGMTASIGFGNFEEGMAAEDLVAKADQHLYQFKGQKKIQG
jgi:two-component system cell cycle response regulator